MSSPAPTPSASASSSVPRPGAAAPADDADVDSLSSRFSSMRVERVNSQNQRGAPRHAGAGVGAGMPPSPHRTPRVCRYFHSGRCTFGDKCRDLHTEPPAVAGAGEQKQQEQQIAPPGGAPVSLSIDDSLAASVSSPLRASRPPRKSIACQWHATAEGCRRGDECFYMHEPRDGPTPPRAARHHNPRVPQSEPRQHRGAGAGVAGAMSHAQHRHEPLPGPAGFDVPAGAMFSDPSVASSGAAPAPFSPMQPLREGSARARAPRSAPHSAPAGRRGGEAGGYVALSPNYLARSLAAPEAAGFRAAGVFAFHRSSATGRVSVLFGLEGASSKNAFHLNVLGGKVDRGESALQTAAREFWEESGTVFSPSAADVAARLAQGDVLWYRDAKYALHFLELTDAEADIDRRYAAERARASAESAAGGAAVVDVHSEMDELLFIDLFVLMRYLNAQIGRPAQGRSSRGAQSECGPVLTSVGPRPMINFTAAMLNCPEVRERMIGWLEATNGEEGRAQAAEIREGALRKLNKQRRSDGQRNANSSAPRQSEGAHTGEANGDQAATAAAPAAVPSDDSAAPAAAPSSAASAGPSATPGDRS